MISVADVCNCVKRLHPDLRHRVTNDTLIKYQKAVECFTFYLHRQPDLSLHSAEDLDLMIMEFRTEMDLTKAQHVTLVAAVEFFLPYTKGKLVVCREALKGRASAEPTKHTTPLTTELAWLFGALMASQGKRAIGAAMIVQQATGLRPSELLALQCDHVFVPRDCSQSITLRLGAVVSTKVKREQFVLVRPGVQSLAYALLRNLCDAAADGAKLFPFGYNTYNNAFKVCEQHYQLRMGFTAHSPRAGFATSHVISGTPVKEIQAAGRWLCESSFQTYVDVVAAAHIRAQVQSTQLQETYQWVRHRINQYFGLQDSDVPFQSSISGQARLSFQTGARYDSRSAGQPIHTSEAAMAHSALGRDMGHQTDSKGKGRSRAQTPAFSKGKGRGILRRRHPSTATMD